MIYLASPYSSPDPKIRQARYELTCEAVVNFLHRDFHIYSPIVHCHEIAQLGNLPTDFAFWRAYNFNMISCSRKLFVLCLPGWKESIGVINEIEYAKQLGMHIVFWNEDAKYWRVRESHEWSE